MIMVDLQIKDVPAELYQHIQWLAAKRDSSIGSLILEVIEREIQQEEWWELWDSFPKFDGEIDSVRWIREAREENDRKLTEHLDRRERENWA